MSAPLPPNEPQRLQALQQFDILDTPSEEAFDRLTRLATQLFQVPIALVSLLDQDRQWFKSCIGLDLRQTDRQLSFCSYAILSDDVFVVPDATQDGRFAENSLVTGSPNIRFYAGAPLKTRDGFNLGSLCIIDTKPREFSEQDAASLRDLAAIAVTELELRHAAKVLREESAELGRNQERLRLLEMVVVNANDAILITEAEPTDLPGPRIVYINEAFTRMTGYTSQDVIGQTPRILQGPDTDRTALDKIRVALERWRAIVVDVFNYKKDGTPFWVELSIVPVANEKGWYTHWISIQRDISERRQIEAQTRESEANLSALTENTADGIWSIDSDYRVLTFNSVFQDNLLKAFGTQISVGTNLSKVLPSKMNGYWIALYDRALAGERFSVEHNYVVEGEDNFYDVSFNPIVNSGKVTGVAVFSKNITVRKQTEAALEAVKDEAERANRAKSEFLSRMSHELRTPMNAILGFAQLMEMDELNEEQTEGVKQILKGGRHLLDLINEVLDIARIESGQLSLSPEPVRVSEVVREALALVQPLAIGRDILIENELDSRNCHVVADRQRFKQVILNLLSNAVKYNRQGGSVRLTCGPVEDWMRIEISDTGTGIAPGSMERLFVPFERLGAEHSGVEGVGIGLSICQRLIGVMGGKIGVESVENQGSTFWIELPRAEDPLESYERDEAVASIAESETLDRPLRTVLYIEDNLSNLKLIERVLARRADIRLVVAMQGRRGLEIARDQKPDLILLDLHLPDISGDQVLQELRAEAETRDIPIVMLSADATPNQIERLLAIGANEYLTKPLDVKQFLQVIEQTL